MRPSAPKCSKVLPWRTGACHHAPEPYKTRRILIPLKGGKVFKIENPWELKNVKMTRAQLFCTCAHLCTGVRPVHRPVHRCAQVCTDLCTGLCRVLPITGHHWADLCTGQKSNFRPVHRSEMAAALCTDVHRCQTPVHRYFG